MMQVSLRLNVLDYRLKNDSYQVILSKVKRDEEGNIKYKQENGVTKEDVKTISYHKNVSMALSAIARDHVFTCDKEITTLKEYADELKHIKTEFDKALKLKELF